jgi:hypothetical protein
MRPQAFESDRLCASLHVLLGEGWGDAASQGLPEEIAPRGRARVLGEVLWKQGTRRASSRGNSEGNHWYEWSGPRLGGCGTLAKPPGRWTAEARRER